jgi:hypothetical protein
MKKIFLSVVFQIGVNVIGLPDFHKVSVLVPKTLKSKFHK